MMSKLVQSILTPKSVALRKLPALGIQLPRKLHTNNIPVKEIQIPVQWGHISAKLWGDENRRPILALHGWQDNAGTWDPLAPYLANGCSILAIDFPGHGLSSWHPPGMSYNTWHLPQVILQIKEYFKWDKITLLSHSMGAIAAMRFTCLFSDEVDAYVAVDSLVADDYDLDFVIDKVAMHMRKQLKLAHLTGEPPSYPMDQIKQIWNKGTNNSVSMESVHHLIARGTKPSQADPNKFYFSRDSRLKYVVFCPEDKKFMAALVNKLLAPTLYIKAIESPYSDDAYAVDNRNIIAQNNKRFEFKEISGTHHVHLNNPEVVAPLVIEFLKKYNLFN